VRSSGETNSAANVTDCFARHTDRRTAFAAPPTRNRGVGRSSGVLHG
jgi:hypothetical protein